MEVRVDDLPDRLFGQALDLVVQRARRRRLAVRVHHHHAVVRHDHRGVAVDLVARRRDGGVHAVADLLQLEEVLAGRLGVGRHDATELVGVERVNGRGRQTDLGQHLSTCPHRDLPGRMWARC